MSVRKCIQCKAITSRKRRCKRTTCKYGPYCFQHTRSIEGVEIKKSKLPGAGLGLFATRKHKKGSRISSYGGEVISKAVHENRDSGYALSIGQGAGPNAKILDGRATSSGNARYVNDCRKADKKHCPSGNNVKLPILRRPRNGGPVKGKLKVMKTIQEGQEIYAPYGRGYWSQGNGGGRKQPKNARRKGRPPKRRSGIPKRRRLR